MLERSHAARPPSHPSPRGRGRARDVGARDPHPRRAGERRRVAVRASRSGRQRREHPSGTDHAGERDGASRSVRPTAELAPPPGPTARRAGHARSDVRAPRSRRETPRPRPTLSLPVLTRSAASPSGLFPSSQDVIMRAENPHLRAGPPPPRPPSVGARLARASWRVVRVVFLLVAGAAPGVPPPPPPPPDPTEQVAEGTPGERVPMP